MVSSVHPSVGQPQVAASLADMCFALEHIDEAKAAVELAMGAAEQAGNYPLVFKLSNNLGAVLRKSEQ